MNFTESSPSELCAKQSLEELLQGYVDYCSTSSDGERTEFDEAPSLKAKTKKPTPKAVFPNLAGFCRYLGRATEELEEIACKYPTEYKRILTVLEDEALNSGLSATLLSAYLKKRLGYEAPQRNSGSSSQLQICFEHDIFEDGE